MYLNQIGNIDFFKGLAGIVGAENGSPRVAEISTAAQQIQRVIIIRIHTHGIHTQEAPVCFVQEAQQLHPFFLFIVIAICAAHVRPGIHLVVTGNNTGNKSAAADIQRIPIHGRFHGFCRIGSKRRGYTGCSDSGAEQCRRSQDG